MGPIEVLGTGRRGDEELQGRPISATESALRGTSSGLTFAAFANPLISKKTSTQNENFMPAVSEWEYPTTVP